jgi:flagellar biosynthesis GTPase FlhF
MLKSAFAQELASAELGGRQCLVSAATALKEGSEDSITHRTTVQVTSAVITPPASFSSHIPDHLSPRTDAVSPRREAVSPRTDAVSPRFEAVSPRREAVSPSAETVSLPHKLVLGLASTPLAVVAPFQALNSTLIEIFPQSVSEISQPSLHTTNQSKQYQVKSKKHQLSPEKQQENPPPPKHYQDAHVKLHHRQQRHDDEQQQQQQHRDQQQQQQHRDQQQQQQHRDQQQHQQHRDQQQQPHRDQQQRSSSSLRSDLDLSMRIFDEDIVR